MNSIKFSKKSNSLKDLIFSLIEKHPMKKIILNILLIYQKMISVSLSLKEAKLKSLLNSIITKKKTIKLLIKF
jgi:hypothetical protein